jgi:small subunit ribosomal protein S3
MGHKISPYALRIGLNENFRSRWFFSKRAQVFLQADQLIRNKIQELFPKSGIAEIVIERKSLEQSKVIIHTSKPGVLIGREGQKLKRLQEVIEKGVQELFKRYNLPKPALEIEVIEIRKPYLYAAILAQLAALEIEKRQTVRRVMKRLIERARQHKEIEGVKVRVSGRLNGSEIHRSEMLSWGKMPLTTLRANIDYAFETAKCPYGIIGVKVWLYKGEGSSEAEE